MDRASAGTLGSALGAPAVVVGVALLLVVVPVPYTPQSAWGPLPTAWTAADPAGARPIAIGAGAVYDLERIAPPESPLHASFFLNATYRVVARSETDGAMLWQSGPVRLTDQRNDAPAGECWIEAGGSVEWITEATGVYAANRSLALGTAPWYVLLRWNATTGAWGDATALAELTGGSLSGAQCASGDGRLVLASWSIDLVRSFLTVREVLPPAIAGTGWSRILGLAYPNSYVVPPVFSVQLGQNSVVLVNRLRSENVTVLNASDGSTITAGGLTQYYTSSAPSEYGLSGGSTFAYLCPPLGLGRVDLCLRSLTRFTVLKMIPLNSTLSEITPATVLSDGTTVLFDEGREQFRAFAADGAPAWTAPWPLPVPGNSTAGFVYEPAVAFGSRWVLLTVLVEPPVARAGTGPYTEEFWLGDGSTGAGAWSTTVALPILTSSSFGQGPAWYRPLAADGTSLVYVCVDHFGVASFRTLADAGPVGPG